jgi:hypothetical protein
VNEINNLNVGVTMGNKKILLLLYADDIVFVAAKEANM